MYATKKMKIRNFGPIKNGFESADGFFDLKKLTVFIGEQGTGKSTVAKLYSTFSWLEKAFYRGDYEIISLKDFQDLTSMQQLPLSYFSDKTEIVYEGNAYNFICKNNNFTIKKAKTYDDYHRAKIMYFCAERNLLSVLKNPENLDDIPNMLSVFSHRYESAKDYFKNKEMSLPLKNYSVKLNADKSIYITSKNLESKVLLQQASSGMQSIVPIILTERFLSENIEKNILDKLIDVKSSKMQKNLLNKIENETLSSKLETFFVSGIKSPFSQNDIAQLNLSFKKYFNFCLTSVVEEPELNLYPISQKDMVSNLISCINENENNSLLVTTHSPYILGSLNNCLYAGNLSEEGFNCDSIIKKSEQLSVKDICAYKIIDGTIKSIIDDDLGLIKNSEIDECSDLINEEYQKLEDIELR